MQRYFINNSDFLLEDSDIHHILHVMRMKIGDHFEIVCDKKLYNCEITCLSPFSFKKEIRLEDSEINKRVTLFFALSKGDKIEFVIQKATELGANRIILFRSNRSIVKMSQEDFNKKLVRYQKIAKEASEQSHRLLIPEIIGVLDIKDISNYLEDINLLAYEKNAGPIKDDFIFDENVNGVSFMVGSEGGFNEEEVNQLVSIGFKTISLGKRIYRCETAAIYGLSVLAYILER